jgi:hypothetical protein
MRAPIPAPGSDSPRRRLQDTVQDAVLELERAVRDLLESSWEEPERRRAHAMALALSDAGRLAGLRELAGAARAAASLLRLRAEDILDIEDALREKILDLVQLLKETGGLGSETA